MGRYNNSEDEIWEVLDEAYDGDDGLSEEEKDYIEKGASLYEHDPMDDKNTLYRPGENVNFVDNIVIDMTMEDGSVLSYELVGRIDIFERTYVMLHNVDSKDPSELAVARVLENPDGTAVFEDIKDEKEFQEVNEQIRRLLTDDPNAVDIENGGVQFND